jgi:bifunctional DNA-binding transcriptional regulator/antitoxin component of YhaV-PrlF toxin-antitoxin module
MVELGVYESKVIAGRSFRTVIPKPVAKALKLEKGSKLSWELRVEDREVFVIVRKAVTTESLALQGGEEVRSLGKIDDEPAQGH